MAREIVEIPGALREEERFAFSEDADGVEERIRAAAEAEANAPLEAAKATKDALDERAADAAEMAKARRQRRVQRAREVLGEAKAPKAIASERRPAESGKAKASDEKAASKNDK